MSDVETFGVRRGKDCIILKKRKKYKKKKGKKEKRDFSSTPAPAVCLGYRNILQHLNPAR